MGPASQEKMQALLESLSPDLRKTFPTPESIPAAALALEGLIKHTADRVFQIENETELPSGNVRVDYASIQPQMRIEKRMEFQNTADGWRLVLPPEATDRIALILADPVKLKLVLAGGQIKGMRAWTDR